MSSGKLNSETVWLHDLIALSDSMYHNDIRLILKSSDQISGQFVCIHHAYNGLDSRINCFYWSPKNIGYGWVIDRGKC